MRSKWFRGLKRSADAALEKNEIPTLTLTNWNPLLQAVLKRVSSLEDTDLFLIYFSTYSRRGRFGEAPTLVVGGVQPLISASKYPVAVFINASGLIEEGIEPGSEVLGWARAGFDAQEGRSGQSFGAGPLSEQQFASAFLSAMDVFAMFYGVSALGHILTLGDPLFEEILDATPGLARRKAGKYQIK